MARWQEIVDAGQQFSRSTSYWTPVEAEANRFAAEFLMPAGLLARAASALIKARKERRHTVASQDLIESLSDYFEVSQKTMKYRLENLGVLTEA